MLLATTPHHAGLTPTEARVIDTHASVAGRDVEPAFADGQRVLQWEGASSVYFAATGRLWVHNHTPRKQAYQELYFHAVGSVCGTLTCSHVLKFWDLRRHATPREMCRIQGFPENFLPPRTRVARLVGNAVAVPCAVHACSCVVATHEELVHLDVCAGMGGFSCAMRAACPRTRCAGFSEVMPAAVACFRSNFPGAPGLGDATTVDAWPRADVLTAGFPCQPFSCANTRVRRAKHSKRDFFQVVLDAIRSSQATRIVLENVPSLMSTGLEQWNNLLDELQGPLGFVCDYTVLNALDFGLPQHRKRLYLVGRCDGVPLLRLNDFVPSDVATLRSILTREDASGAHRVA
jgi:site-specific DNA-cytosine methylase